jgi:hypothetical protein
MFNFSQTWCFTYSLSARVMMSRWPFDGGSNEPAYNPTLLVQVVLRGAATALHRCENKQAERRGGLRSIYNLYQLNAVMAKPDDSEECREVVPFTMPSHHCRLFIAYPVLPSDMEFSRSAFVDGLQDIGPIQVSVRGSGSVALRRAVYCVSTGRLYDLTLC